MTLINYDTRISRDINIATHQVAAVIKLLDDDATVPFIARYRKEATGGLDETVITAIRDRLEQLKALDKRKEAILKSLSERELLTDQLKDAIDKAADMTALEDIYLPYKPKKRTKASIAKEKGLEPLAKMIFEQSDIDPYSEAEKYVNRKKEVNSIDEALMGAMDIIAEWVSEDKNVRTLLRELYQKDAFIESKVIKDKEDEAKKYADYFDWSEPLSKAPSHRILAMRRGEKESVLSIHITVDSDKAVKSITKEIIKANNKCSQLVETAIQDCYKRLLAPSMETEFKNSSKKNADEAAIKVFAQNLRELLMAPPLGQKRIMAIDPGFRTGCKVVCLDESGKLLHHSTIYPHNGEAQKEKAKDEVLTLTDKNNIEVIAVGNGTAGRETIAFLKEIEFEMNIVIEMVNESGASIYSASEVAREEFPDYDITVRGSVSIGRRLMDPLSELVKIDPKSVGVGQYQHDVNQTEIKKSLDDVVISCVNSVGVELNTASKQLLTYVSGLNSNLAKKIVEHRNKFGIYSSRDALMDVSGVGPKVFEQAAGFLRINNSENPLDKTAVHPESYEIVYKMAEDNNCSVTELIEFKNIREVIDLNSYVTSTTGLPTLMDILDELEQPGRDPRREYTPFSFDDNIQSITDLKKGMKIPGIVTNVTAFGAFVDIGVHQDGLIHISEMADKFVENPSDILKVHQKVSVTVLDIDIDRNRISLSLRENRKQT